MTTVTVIGTGNMGQAIGGLVGKSGNTLELIGDDDKDKHATGEIVVLAVPYPAVAEILEERRDQLSDKVIVDITNPLNFETMDSLTVASDGSAAAEIARALPQARVLKAFNTTFAGTLAAGAVGPLTTTVMIAGDDHDAKTLLAGVITGAGLKVIDVGPLKRAREMEAMGFLQISLAANEKIPWTGGFGIVD